MGTMCCIIIQIDLCYSRKEMNDRESTSDHGFVEGFMGQRRSNESEGDMPSNGYILHLFGRRDPNKRRSAATDCFFTKEST